MAINPKIKERAEKIRKEVYGKDVREALASGLEVMSEDVEDVKDRQGNVELQFQAVLDETTGKDIISAPEVTAARVGADGTQHMNLKQRLDSEHDKITAQLAQIEQTKIDQVLFDINTFSVKFYAQGNLITSVNISEAGNAQAVQDYIDTLVANGQIKGVTLADESVTGHKLHPYISGFNNNRTELRYQDGLLVEAVEKDGDLTVSRIRLTYSDDGKLDKITEQAFGKTVETTLVHYTDGRLSYTQNVLR